jgi:hypothetical protein
VVARFDGEDEEDEAGDRASGARGGLGGRERCYEGYAGAHAFFFGDARGCCDDNQCVRVDICDSAVGQWMRGRTDVFCVCVQLNTIHNVAEERKTMKRSNSLSGKLANLSISKKHSPRLQKKSKDGKKGLTRTVSFSSSERQELEFDDDTDLDTSSSEDSMLSEASTPTANRQADSLDIGATSCRGTDIETSTASEAYADKDMQDFLDFKHQLKHQCNPTSVCHGGVPVVH